MVGGHVQSLLTMVTALNYAFVGVGFALSATFLFRNL